MPHANRLWFEFNSTSSSSAVLVEATSTVLVSCAAQWHISSDLLSQSETHALCALTSARHSCQSCSRDLILPALRQMPCSSLLDCRTAKE